MSQIYNENTKVPKPKENQVGILGISSREFMDSVGNSAEGLEFRRKHCRDYVSTFENTPKSCRISTQKLTRLYLVVQGKAQLEHS